MTTIPKIPVDLYNYVLPEEKIAHFPASPRDHSKLLLFQNNKVDSIYHKSKLVPGVEKMPFAFLEKLSIMTSMSILNPYTKKINLNSLT